MQRSSLRNERQAFGLTSRFKAGQIQDVPGGVGGPPYGGRSIQKKEAMQKKKIRTVFFLAVLSVFGGGIIIGMSLLMFADFLPVDPLESKFLSPFVWIFGIGFLFWVLCGIAGSLKSGSLWLCDVIKGKVDVADLSYNFFRLVVILLLIFCFVYVDSVPPKPQWPLTVSFVLLAGFLLLALHRGSEGDRWRKRQKKQKSKKDAPK
jgi:hypothetical protein